MRDLRISEVADDKDDVESPSDVRDCDAGDLADHGVEGDCLTVRGKNPRVKLWPSAKGQGSLTGSHRRNGHALGSCVSVKD